MGKQTIVCKFQVKQKIGGNMNQKNFELKPMRIGDVLDYSIEVFKSNFKNLSLLVLLLYLPWVFIYSLVTGKLLGDQASFYADIFSAAIFQSNYVEDIGRFNELQNNSIFTSILAQLVSLLHYGYKITIELVFNAAVIRIIYSHIVKGNAYKYDFNGIKGLIRDSFKYLPRMMGNAALFFVIFYIAYFVMILIAVITAVIPIMVIVTTAPDSVFSVVAVIVIALLVSAGLVLALSYVMARVIFGAHAIVIEGYSVTESIKRSMALTKGNYWRVAPACIFAAILFFLVGNMFSTLSVLFLFINDNLFRLMYTVTEVIGAFMYPFVMVFLTVLFVSIKIKNEGLDLEIKVDKLLEGKSQKQYTEYGILDEGSTDA